MSAVWLKMVTVLVVLMVTEAGVTWKKVGEPITIQCRADSTQEQLTLVRGLIVEKRIFHYSKPTSKRTFDQDMKERIQTNGDFPNMDILIKNLTVNDTGPYWCVYSTIDGHSQPTKGSGSLLLVVTDNQLAAETKDPLVCESSDLNLIILSAVAFAATVLVIMLFLIIRLACKKRNSSSSSVKTGRLTNNNDVYEDMRGTIRR